MEPDFSGYVTKANLECADGRVIMPGAFAHQDGAKVPLVFQHNHNDISQVLGHVILKNKDDGVWGDAYLNGEKQGKTAKGLVQHGDVDKFSIWAKNLEESGFNVHHGDIQEVSLVLAGANPGARVENVLMHSSLSDDDNLFIAGFEIKDFKHADDDDDDDDDDERTVGDVLETLTEDQKTAVNAVIQDLVDEGITEQLTQQETAVEHGNLNDSQKGTKMAIKRNVFDQTKNAPAEKAELKHDDVKSLLNAAKGPNRDGGNGATPSLREFVRSSQGKELLHADDYGIQNIEILFPDAQALMDTPRFVDRRQEWVKTVLAGVGHSPFARVKSTYADITADEARARGYIKGNQKVDEVFPVFKRTTGPAWVYKRQKLDREDIINVTSFDVVAWMKVEMRGKLDEEIARAILFGDGRPAMVNGDINPDKIQDPGATNTSGDGIRAIVNDHELYVATIDVPMVANPKGNDWNVLLDTVTEQQEFYKGSGNKTAFMSYRVATKLLTMRDNFGKRQYRNLSEVAGDMDVSRIERVPTELMPQGVLCIVVDLADYNVGTDRGGEITLFDDFDIDFNQYKYLMETYMSGALTIPYSAQIYKQTQSTETVITPPAPINANNVVVIPVQNGIVYKDNAGNTLSPGSVIILDDTDVLTLTVVAEALNGYSIAEGADDEWEFEYEEAEA